MMRNILLIVAAVVSTTCSTPYRGRIVGGHDVVIEDYPYQVSLEYQGVHFCGGSIYKSNVIITASRCVGFVKPSDMAIRAGSNRRQSGGVLIAASKIFTADNWSEHTIDSDIAVIILKEELTFSNKIQPIELAEKEPTDGQLAYVSGWGLLEEGKPKLPTILQGVEYPIWNKEECNQIYENKITENMFCAGYQPGGKGVCQMDSGGPLVVNGKLAGIVSWSIGCAEPNYPNVFTTVSNFIDWIKEKSK